MFTCSWFFKGWISCRFSEFFVTIATSHYGNSQKITCLCLLFFFTLFRNEDKRKDQGIEESQFVCRVFANRIDAPSTREVDRLIWNRNKLNGGSKLMIIVSTDFYRLCKQEGLFYFTPPGIWRTLRVNSMSVSRRWANSHSPTRSNTVEFI